MRRRDLLLAPFALQALVAQPAKPREWVTAAASRDTAPRVGLVPSTFKGGAELDGRKIRPLARPAPLDAPLSAAQLDDMLRLAVELGGGRRGGLATAIDRDDWVVIKVTLPFCPGEPGDITDPRLVQTVLAYLAERGLGRRFTIAEAVPCPLAWTSEHEGASYNGIVAKLSRKYPANRYELVDLKQAPKLEMPVEGHVVSQRNPKGIYRIPRLLRECDKVISIAPLAAPVGLSLHNYLSFSPGAEGIEAVDLFSFHPADYAILSGRNVIVAGTNAPAVDSVGAAIMGFDSTAIAHLELAAKRGYGLNDAYSIWTRGVEIDEAKPAFAKP